MQVDTRSFHPSWRRVLELGWPISLQALAMASFGLVDVAMVQSLGAEALAAVGLAGRALFVLTMTVAGLANGAAVLLSQLAGRGQMKAAARLVRALASMTVALTLPVAGLAVAAPLPLAELLTDDAAVTGPLAAFIGAVGLSLPLSALTAALSTASRCVGDSRSPLLAGLAGLAINAALNAVLIFGSLGMPALGVAGAGWATTTARVLEALLLLGLMGRRGQPGRALLRGMLEAGVAAPRFVRLAAPFMLQELVWSGSTLGYTLIVGAMGAQSLALVSLIAPAEGLLVVIFLGGAVGTGIVIGQLLGQHRFAEARWLARRALRRFGLAALPVSAAGAAVAAVLFSRLSWLDDPIHNLWPLLTVSAVTVSVRVIAMVLVLGVLRAGGDRFGVLAIEVAGSLAVGLPAVAGAALLFEACLLHVMALLLGIETLKLAALLWRMNQGVWLRSLLPPAAAAPR